MARLIIIDNPDITLWYYEETNILHHQSHKIITGDSFRLVLTEGLNVAKKYGVQKWLSDDRRNSVQSREDIDWANTVWTPQMIKAGWKYWAIILPEIMIGQLNMNHYIKSFKEYNFVVNTFTDPEEALKWLEEIG